MRNEAQPTETSRLYRAAYAAHYSDRDLPSALRLYRDVMTLHPNAPEAGYSRTQVQNIVNAVVPEQVLLDAQIALAQAQLESSTEDHEM